MARLSFVCAGLFLAGAANAQTAGPSLGLKLAKVPDALYAQLPDLPKNQGVLVESVKPNSPAWRGGLRPFDIIMSLDSQPLADGKAAEKKLRQAKAGQGVGLVLWRAGHATVLAFDPHRPDNALEATKGLTKPGGPPAVTIHLQPMDDGQLSLVLIYYSDKSGKLERLSYKGPLGDIERQIHTDAGAKRLPDRVQDLVEVALQRVRTINQSQK
jgi:hypothetical protein